MTHCSSSIFPTNPGSHGDEQHDENFVGVESEDPEHIGCPPTRYLVGTRQPSTPPVFPHVDLRCVWNAGLMLKWVAAAARREGVFGKLVDCAVSFKAFRDPRLSPLPVDDYVVRVTRLFQCSNECVVLAVVYMDRLVERFGLRLDEWNVRNLFLSSLTIATKFHNHSRNTNDYYADVGQVCRRHFDFMESTLLRLLDAHTDVSEDEFRCAYSSIQKDGEGICSSYGQYLTCRLLIEPLASLRRNIGYQAPFCRCPEMDSGLSGTSSVRPSTRQESYSAEPQSASNRKMPAPNLAVSGEADKSTFDHNESPHLQGQAPSPLTSVTPTVDEGGDEKVSDEAEYSSARSEQRANTEDEKSEYHASETPTAGKPSKYASKSWFRVCVEVGLCCLVLVLICPFVY